MPDVTPPPAAVAETHSAWVVFLGDRAYKLKKPVRLDFLDFSTREAREAAAHREVELNRRLAPDVYLGVADVLAPDGKVCDHLVMMRRLPAERRLSALVGAGEDLGAEIRQIARAVAAFHAGAATSPTISAAGAPEAIRGKVERDLEELRGLAGTLLDADVLDEVTSLISRYLAGRTALLQARVARGCIRDGHGDLLADDIFCLPDGPRILDCIEFNDGLRYGDVLADIAFLAMDLEHLGAPGLAEQLFASYREFTDEQHPDTLAHYYIAFRALIRSKVACTRAEQSDVAQRVTARGLLALARSHLRRARVRLVLVGGAPGTGKSTVAAGLSERLGWIVLRSDDVRKDVTGVGRAAREASPLGAGIYDATATSATYSALLEQARHALGLGESVILDASWSRDATRRAAAEVARDTASDLVELCCEAPADLAVARVARRQAHGVDVSDATPEVATAMRAAFEAWPSAKVISTAAPPGDTVHAALAVLDVD
jgi:hypothetical protein